MFRVSCIQLKSNNNINQNLKNTEKLILRAVKQKADFILTPEVSSLFSLNKKHLLKICKPMRKDEYLLGIKQLAKKYKNVDDIIWCQEEPANQGAWFSHRHRLQRVLDRLDFAKEISMVSRPPAAAPAVGMMKLHLEQQNNLLEEALQ